MIVCCSPIACSASRSATSGYLLKHVQIKLNRRTQAALADLGVSPRDVGVLRVIAGGQARSQQEIAATLEVDAPSLVPLIDALESRHLVVRSPSETDRRRNVVALTDQGWDLLRQAEERYDEAERSFTTALGDAGASDLRLKLHTLLHSNT